MQTSPPEASRVRTSTSQPRVPSAGYRLHSSAQNQNRIRRAGSHGTAFLLNLQRPQAKQQTCRIENKQPISKDLVRPGSSDRWECDWRSREYSHRGRKEPEKEETLQLPRFFREHGTGWAGVQFQPRNTVRNPLLRSEKPLLVLFLAGRAMPGPR